MVLHGLKKKMMYESTHHLVAKMEYSEKIATRKIAGQEKKL